MFSNKVNRLKRNNTLYPEVLRHIPSPPEQLFYVGADPKDWISRPKVAIVGSRKISPYGKDITSRLSSELARAGVVIISGLAYGVDAAAHQACLEAGGVTVAVLGTPVEQISPATHFQLAKAILGKGGTILSEYERGLMGFRGNFVARNRIVSGLSDVLLITEAAVNSGSLHTARFALEQGKTVMAVPGNITSPTSEGCNNLIKSGAIPVTEASDVFFALKINPKVSTSKKTFRGSPEEENLFRLIQEGVQSQEELALICQLDGSTVSSALTSLEISGVIRPRGGGQWIVS